MSKSASKDLGNLGEAMACGHLRANGYFILSRNWRCGEKEVDIIACQGDLAVFVEVKLRSGSVYGDAEEFVDARKMNFLVEAAESWLQQDKWEGEVRFDIIAITKENGRFLLEHIEDAFRADPV